MQSTPETPPEREIEIGPIELSRVEVIPLKTKLECTLLKLVVSDAFSYLVKTTAKIFETTKCSNNQINASKTTNLFLQCREVEETPKG